MNSIHTLGKTLFGSYSFRLSRLYVNKYEYGVQYLCSAADNNTKIQYSDSKTSYNSTQNSVDSDTFGALKASLENRHRFSRKPEGRSTKLENKKTVKVKRPKNDEADTFGNLSENKPVWYPDINEEPKIDNDLSDDSVIIKSLSKRYRNPQRYLEEMKELVKQKKVKDALNLFVDMRRNFVTPFLSHYTYMIGVCGKVGYTEMAFKLLRQLTDRAMQPTPALLTGLFNSCAESPFPEYGLKKAHALKEKIELRNWPRTQITYHAMIKAFGKCGDIKTAFMIVDEMAKADIKINAETYCFLLMSCISNKEAGFTYAVEVMRMMRTKKVMPTNFTFNLLLRATRDCGVGPEEISCLLLQHWSSYSKRPYGFVTKESLASLAKERPLELKSGSNNCANESLEKGNENSSTEGQNEEMNESFDEENRPKYELKSVNSDVMTAKSRIPTAGVLSARPISGPEILEIVNIKTPGDRLSVIGGMDGFLKLMSDSKVKPDIKTFTLLLECIPDNIQEEEKLLSILDFHKVKPDIAFFNALIKRRNFRKEAEAARDVLILINKYELTPDIMTFGSLVLGCRTLHQATLFISEMKKMGSHPNAEIVGSMARQASMTLNFPYMKYVLELMEKEQIKPDRRILSNLEKSLSGARKNIILMEHGKKVDAFYQKENLPKDFSEFFNFYEEWLKKMKFQPEEHPWSQYKTDIIDRAKEEYSQRC